MALRPQNLKAAGDSKVRPEAAQFSRPPLGTGTLSHPPSLTLYIPVPYLPLLHPRKQHSAAKSVKRKKKICITPSKR